MLISILIACLGLVFIAVLCAFLFLSVVNSIYYGIPHVATFTSDIRVMRDGLRSYPINNKRLLDLGSGSGRMVRFFEREFGMVCTGYEVDLGNHLFAHFLGWIMRSHACLVKGDFNKLSFRDYDVVYMYLFPEIVMRIEDRIWQECAPGTLIVSNAFKLQKHTPIEILKDKK